MNKVVYRPLLVCAFLLLVCSGSAKAEDWLYTIRLGDNLWNIAERHLVSAKYVPHAAA